MGIGPCGARGGSRLASGVARGGLEGVERAGGLAGRSLGVPSRTLPGGGADAADLGATLTARVAVAAGARVAGRSTALVNGGREVVARVAALGTPSLAAAFAVTTGAATPATDRVVVSAGDAARLGAALVDTGRTELLDLGGMDRASERSAAPPGRGELAGRRVARNCPDACRAVGASGAELPAEAGSSSRSQPASRSSPNGSSAGGFAAMNATESVVTRRGDYVSAERRFSRWPAACSTAPRPAHTLAGLASASPPRRRARRRERRTRGRRGRARVRPTTPSARASPAGVRCGA